MLCFLKTVSLLYFLLKKRSILAKSINRFNCMTVALTENSAQTNEYDIGWPHKGVIPGWKQNAKYWNPTNPTSPILLPSQIVCPELKKKKWKISLKSLRGRLQNLIKMPHESLIVFSVKVRCHVQKVLFFDVSKELCNWISLFIGQIQAYAIL